MGPTVLHTMAGTSHSQVFQLHLADFLDHEAYLHGELNRLLTAVNSVTGQTEETERRMFDAFRGQVRKAQSWMAKYNQLLASLKQAECHAAKAQRMVDLTEHQQQWRCQLEVAFHKRDADAANYCRH